MRRDTRQRLLTESTTTDGATLWLVLNKLSDQATVDDILVELENEEHLINMILGGLPNRSDLAQYRLFVNETAARRFAEARVSQGGEVAPATPQDEPAATRNKWPWWQH